MRLKELVVKLSSIRRVTERHGSEETGSWFETDPDGDFVEYGDLDLLIQDLKREITRQEEINRQFERLQEE